MRENNEPKPKKPFEMGTVYHIAAGAIYLFVAYMVYSNSPADWNEGLTHGIAAVAALYGLFRIGRGIMNIIKK